MIVGEYAVSRGESNEYRPEDQSQSSEDDLLSQPLDFDDLADDSASGSPSESGPTSDIFTFESEPAAGADRVEPEQASGSGAFSFEPDDSAEPASAKLPSESADAAPLDQWQPQPSDEGELIASSPDEAADAAEPAQAFDGQPEWAAADPSDASLGEQESPVFADQEAETLAGQEAEAAASAEDRAETGIPGELPAGLLGIGGDEPAATDESIDTAEQSEEEEKEKKPSLLHRLAEASPYTVMLGLSCVAILLACIFLMIELLRYDFDVGAKSGKKLSHAGVAAERTVPVEFLSKRMLG